MENIGRYLDHAVLKPELTREEARAAIELGIGCGVKTVCVRPCDIKMAAEMCKGSETAVSCVLAFPHGNTLTAVKISEAAAYCALGAAEIDMVANYGFIKSSMWDAVREEISAVVQTAHSRGVAVKVIVESGVLTLGEVIDSTRVCAEAGADFIKTSTGFNGGGATEEAVKAMLENGGIKVKASGGIRSRETALKFIALGCARLGVNYTSTPVICGR